MTRSWQTRLIHPERHAPEGFEGLNTATHRASTTIFPNAASVTDDWRIDRVGYTYGLYGTPTVRELAAQIASLENAYDTLIVPGGQAALTLIYLAFASAGDHVLIPESVYGPSRGIADAVLRRFGVDVEYYPPTIGGDIARLLRDTTRLVWCESPGSVTMEVQDVRAIARAAHERGAVVALDNTYAAGVLFDAFANEVDVSMQALTKYVGGHSDIILGSVSARDEAIFERLGAVHQHLGMNASPDDCSLALRGIKTMAVRLKALETSTLAVARWLADRPEVERVLHPALPSCPGHDLFARDFTGSTSIFSVVLRADYTRERVNAFIDALQLFKIGYSWGGVTSLVVPHFDPPGRSTPPSGLLVRFNIGLEEPRELMNDLESAFEVLRP